MNKCLTLSLFSSVALSSAVKTHQDVSSLLPSAQKLHTPSLLLPKGWTSLQRTDAKTSSSLSGKVSTETSGYFVLNVFYNNQCGGQRSFEYGTGTGVCFVGMNNNTAVGSVYYDFGGVYGDNFYINQGVWESLDCTGTPIVNSFPIPTTCFADDSNPSTTFRYSYTTSSDPSASYEPGFTFQYYDTVEQCGDGGSGGSYAYYVLNTCIVSDDAGSLTFSQCDAENGLYQMTRYSDPKCQDFEYSFTTKLEQCAYQDSSENDDEDISVNTFSTYVCN